MSGTACLIPEIEEDVMDSRETRILHSAAATRRQILKGSAAAGIASVAGMAGRRPVSAQDDSIVFLSSQLSPIAEAEAMRNTILADFEGQVDFVPEDVGPFNDRVLAEAEAGSGEVSLIGGLHGDFAAFQADGLLMDLSDLLEELSDRNLVADFVELGRFGTDQIFYIPWMQATYIMAARTEALDHLPEGVDETVLQESLTYEQLGQWAAAINEAEGQRFGLPASDDGLLHRFLQGYGYPSFTGGVNTTFASADAVAMWEWLRTIWEVSDPQSVTYGIMSEPLLSGSVWLTWDHTARLIDALRQIPDQIVTFPAPIGPAGRGYMPVVAGLGIPNTAPNQEGARALIEYLTRPETQTLTLQEVAFFPVVEIAEAAELDAGTQKEADAVQQTTASADALASVLPIGLGEQGGAYNTVFRNAFQSIILNGNDIQETLDAEAANLQEVLDTAGASCWAPDPPSDGVCQVG
jgi:multiple sugar transport system substrate-binding protein